MTPKAGVQVKLLAAWFCPYAQRAWVAAEEKGLVQGVDYEVEEALSLAAGSDIYAKTPLLLEASPQGLVPVLLDQRADRPQADQEGCGRLGTVVRESLVCLEYIDEAFEGTARLMPPTPGQRARCRLWFDWIDKNVCTPFYRSMVLQDGAAQAQALQALTQALAHFAAELKGPYFLGEQFSAVDIAIVPWVARLPVLRHYRGYSLPDTDSLPKLKAWMALAMARPSVRATLADPDRLLALYQRYANGTAHSKVGDDIRAGKTV